MEEKWIPHYPRRNRAKNDSILKFLNFWHQLFALDDLTQQCGYGFNKDRVVHVTVSGKTIIRLVLQLKILFLYEFN